MTRDDATIKGHSKIFSESFDPNWKIWNRRIGMSRRTHISTANQFSTTLSESGRWAHISTANQFRRFTSQMSIRVTIIPRISPVAAISETIAREPQILGRRIGKLRRLSEKMEICLERLAPQAREH
jgi:hypothetical protein